MAKLKDQMTSEIAGVEINYQNLQIYLQDDSKNEDKEELQKPEPEELELPF